MVDSYQRLLRRYAGYIQRAGHVEAASIALRTRSESMRDVVAYVATQDSFTVAELSPFLEAGHLPEGKYRYRWMATLGRIIALQAFQAEDELKHSEDIQLGLACLRIANRRIPKDNQHKQFHRLEVELLMRRGDLTEAAELIRSNDFLLNYYHGYLLSDLDNPTISGTDSTYEDWIDSFSRPFIANGLLPIEPVNRANVFNALSTPSPDPIFEGPKVTVVMTSYKPELEPFLLAVNSILNQSWKNIELIIVDDASSQEYDPVLDQIRKLDPRITVIELPENGGTYRARNVGFAAATGELITGQDSDDWSHPERIERQVSYMTNQPRATGVVVEAVRVDENLVRTSPGRLPERPCEVSLMTRRVLALEVGGYVDARKGADSEFRLRLEYFNGHKVHVIRKPLYLTRIGHESLSGADFKPGWSHPVRRAFWNACRYWHKSAPAEDLRLEVAGRQPMPVPNRFKVVPPEKPPFFDVVYVGDWRAYTGQQRLLIDAIKAHRNKGNRVGVMQLESLISPSKETTRLAPEIQTLINQGLVNEVIPDENAEAAVVVITDATSLQFGPMTGVNLSSQITLVAPDFPPSAGKRKSVLYRPRDCDGMAEKLFHGQVLWTSVDPLVYNSLKQFQDDIRLHSDLMPAAFDPRNWQNSRPRLTGDVPVIGRHSENFIEMWPKNIRVSKQVLPHGPTADVRILGDAKPFLRKFSKREYPLNWLVFRDRDISPEAFMSSLDFFVYFPDERVEQGFSREAIEATAAGALTILPEKFQTVHGDSALYVAPDEIFSVMAAFSRNRQKYLQKVFEAQNYLQVIVDNDRHVRFIEDLSRKADGYQTVGAEV